MPQNVRIQIPKICDYDMLPGKRELRLQMKIRLLINWPWDIEIILDYQGRSDVITSEREKEDVMKK